MAKRDTDFPLRKHANGQWYRKVKGKFHYFGKDKNAALDLWLKDKDYILAGREPPTEGLQVRDILNNFRLLKTQANDEGSLSRRSLDEYVSVLGTIADTLGADTNVKSLRPDDLVALRKRLITSKGGETLAPSSQKRWLSMARTVFLFGNEELDANIKYRKWLRSPTARQMREARNEVGERMFEADEIRKLLRIASPQLRAMILLGINCGFGNDECSTLPIEKVDLDRGWHDYPRPKTVNKRRCPLWPETVAALEHVIDGREEGQVFVTKFGESWHKDSRDCPISKEFRKRCIEAGIYRKGITVFYSLRRTHYTIGLMADKPSASAYIMGHVPESNDMGAIYRQREFDTALRAVTDVIHDWLFSTTPLPPTALFRLRTRLQIA